MGMVAPPGDDPSPGASVLVREGQFFSTNLSQTSPLISPALSSAASPSTSSQGSPNRSRRSSDSNTPSLRSSETSTPSSNTPGLRSASSRSTTQEKRSSTSSTTSTSSFNSENSNTGAPHFSLPPISALPAEMRTTLDEHLSMQPPLTPSHVMTWHNRDGLSLPISDQSSQLFAPVVPETSRLPILIQNQTGNSTTSQQLLGTFPGTTPRLPSSISSGIDLSSQLSQLTSNGQPFLNQSWRSNREL